MSQSGQPGASGPGVTPPAPPPQAPPPPSWQSTPQPPTPPAGGPASTPAQQVPAWAGQMMDRTPVAGPAGFYYADVPNRAIAYIIDYIIYFIALLIIGAITLAILGNDLGLGIRVQTTGSVLVQQVLGFVAAGAYFVYTWVFMRGTVGMRLLGMQIGDEKDGRSLTLNQGVIRFVAMFGPGFVAGLIGAFSLSLGFLALLVSVIWFIVLLVTTAQSPTKQGLHDRYAHSMVVKAARAIG